MADGRVELGEIKCSSLAQKTLDCDSRVVQAEESKEGQCSADNGVAIREQEEKISETPGRIMREAGTDNTTDSEIVEAGATASVRESIDTYEVLTESDLSSLGDWEGLQETCLSEIPPIDPGILQDLEAKARQVSHNLDFMLGTLSNSMRAMNVVTGQHMGVYDSCIEHTSKSVDVSMNSVCKLIALCEQVDASMAPIHKMAAQIKEIKRTLDNFEAVCK